MGSSQITKNQINLELIEIIQFCFKIYGDTPSMVGCMCGLMGGLMDEVM